MDSEPGSIFDDLSSPGLSLLDPRDTNPTVTSDIDLITLNDSIPDWDRALLHPLPPPPRAMVLATNQVSYHAQQPLQLAWMEPQIISSLAVSAPAPAPPAPHHHHPHHNANPFHHQLRDDDEDSVDDTSPATEQKKIPHPKPTVSTVLGQAVQRVSGNTTSHLANSHINAEPSPAEARGNVSHTRRCRQKVNNNFERLLHALPPPPEGVEVKHKAQILTYAIDRFRTIRCHNMRLEMQLAMSSPYQMQRWVRSVVNSTTNLREALKPFMAMICLTKKWKYAELWAPHVRSGRVDTTALKYVTGALSPTLEGDELHRLKLYRYNSRKYVFKPRNGVPGRVFLTMRPEWLPILYDPVAFPRAPHAVRHKVEVTFAVPVIINGSVQMVVEFFDTKRRDYDPETLNMANEIALLFGKAFTGNLSSIGA